MDRFETYKNALAEHNSMLAELKKRVAAIVQQKHLSPVMNDTKWLELQFAVGDLPFPPPYILKCVTDDNHPFSEIDELPEYFGDWSSFYEEGLPPFFNIEWIKVRPRFGKHRGQLIDKEPVDETPQFVAILQRLSIPYEEENGNFVIYGYK